MLPAPLQGIDLAAYFRETGWRWSSETLDVTIACLKSQSITRPRHLAGLGDVSRLDGFETVPLAAVAFVQDRVVVCAS